MLRNLGVIVACFVVTLCGAGSSGDPKSFTGSWKMDMARSESAHQDVPVGPSQMVIRQTGAGLTVETVRSENGKPDAFHETIAFKPDGSESISTGDGGVPVTGKMRMEDGKLITETVRNVQDSTVTTMYVHTLSANGRELTVDKTLTVQHGYQFRGAATTGHGKDIFVRVE